MGNENLGDEKGPRYQVSYEVSFIPPLTPLGNDVVDVWVPQPLETIATIFPEPAISTPSHAGAIVHFWKDHDINEPIRLHYAHDGKPRVPEISDILMRNALRIDEPLTKFSPEIERFLTTYSLLGVNQRPKAIEEKIAWTLAKVLSYEFPPLTRDASQVAQTLKSDCAGYHALFVALMRRNGIPALLDFGFRLPEGHSHAWAWWYDAERARWVMEDINNRQYNPQYKLYYDPRMSTTYGTGLQLEPAFPRPVVFFQGVHFWDHAYDVRPAGRLNKISVDVRVIAKTT